MPCYTPGTNKEHANQSGYCSTVGKNRCPSGTQCCEIGDGKRGCEPSVNSEQDCDAKKGAWHPIVNTCECKPGWTGATCSECKSGFCGTSCEEKNTVCSQAGTAEITVDPDTGCRTCECRGGWSEKDCGTFYVEPCDEGDITCYHGTPKGKKETGCSCVCDDGWSGDHCDVDARCSGAPACQHDGYMRYIEPCKAEGGSCVCECPDGFYGETCEIEVNEFNNADTVWCDAGACYGGLVEGTVTSQRYEESGANCVWPIGSNKDCPPGYSTQKVDDVCPGTWSPFGPIRAGSVNKCTKDRHAANSDDDYNYAKCKFIGGDKCCSLKHCTGDWRTKCCGDSEQCRCNWDLCPKDVNCDCD
jgi:hypothetical protein